jgi:arylsulfatase A-like enzyme
MQADSSESSKAEANSPPKHHLCAYGELIRVPLIIRYQGIIPKGLKIDGCHKTSIYYLTILDILTLTATNLPLLEDIVI